jgi:hypothetical protein
VADRDLPPTGPVSVTARSESAGAGQVFELLPTGRPGVFRGSLRLVPEAEAAVEAGRLRAKDGDLVEFLYEDTHPPQILRVAAVVDTTAPEISAVAVEPDYTEAIVRWTTSEPCDGLAKYGDQGFPSNLTAYHADFVTDHELRLVGLEPDREYELEIVSRDPAGNVRSDDNAGNYHRFRTLKPLTPPFVDDLEAGRGAWSVGESELDDETLSLFTSSTWELDRPANELAQAAHSGSVCWGTNLGGEVNDYADTSLISPAILLSGGNRATLRFFHNYDFLPRSDEGDIIEVGGLYVTTNNGAIWTPLREYGEASDAWEEEEVDLSGFLGRTIRLGWAYGLFSLGAVEHPGWLLDDVSVTVSRYVPGTLVISNSVHQAAVALSGPLNRVERGRGAVITNAPPGEYRWEYADVAYLERPPAQTNRLAEGGTLVIEGRYGFPDANANGLSDLWETRFLGSAAPEYVPTVDTDGDGASDWAEFVAGTNPTNGVSRLVVLPPETAGPGRVRVKWESAAGHGYRVLGSSDARTWAPVTDWLRSAGDAQGTEVPVPGEVFLLRVEAEP